jgi:hypothetical protein
MAHSAGATPVTGRIRVDADDAIAPPSPGTVIQVRLHSGDPAWPRALSSLVRGLQRAGIRVVSVGRLVADSRS